MAELHAREALTSVGPYIRKCANLPIWEMLVSRDRTPSASLAYHCKVTQSTGMAIQMQFEVIWAGDRIAIRVL